jgi:hypothetical protein
MTPLFPDRPDYQPMPRVAVKFCGKIVEVTPVVLLVVGSLGPLCPVHEHQPEPSHREIVIVADPVKALVEALPPSEPMPFSNYDASNDVVRMHWNVQQQKAFQVAANTTMMPSAALWFAANQAARSAVSKPSR